MRQLLLLRHAKAAAAASDRDRPLSPAGWRAGAVIRRAMRELGLAPDLVLVSDARRALETLEALEPWEDTPLVDPLAQLYLADAARIRATLRGVAETVRSVLLIAHNPGLGELVAVLAGGGNVAVARRLAEGFPTAALAEFSVSGPWRLLDASNARLIRLIRPSSLTFE